MQNQWLEHLMLDKLNSQLVRLMRKIMDNNLHYNKHLFYLFYMLLYQNSKHH